MKTSASMVVIACCMSVVSAQTPEQIEFFESRIRPVLAQECYSCHSTLTKNEGNLVLDSRPGWQAGGGNGDIILPGDTKRSLLLQVIRHEHEDANLKMPKHGAKLDNKTIADLEKWILDGAADPRDAPPKREQFEKETSWSVTLQRRAEWWSLKPLEAPHSTDPSPQVLAQEVDRLIESEITRQGLQLAEPADERTVLRRLSFILTGLPPSESEGTQFFSSLTGDSKKGPAREESPSPPFEAWIDRFLASPQYGERWARHFMDWVRYAESYGSEGDPAIPYAWRYRDYLIRAFNDNVPWPQMIREAIAGDLLPNPRLKNGLNESAIGIGQLRMVLHGFSPVDSLDEQVTFTDNQIDTVTKAFQAFTVSCARCHNHKFDAISQTDFYALYGIFTSTHPAVIDANSPGTGDAIRTELEKIQTEIKKTLVNEWLTQLPARPAAEQTKASDNTQAKARSLDFRGAERIRAGEFSIDGETLRVHPSGYLSSRYSSKDRAVVITDRFPCDGGTLWFRLAGKGGAKAKYVVQNFPRTGTIHKAIELKNGKDETLAWRKLNLQFWKGDEIFLQVATAADMPAEHREDAPSWFMLTDAIITQDENAPPNPEVSSSSPRQLVEAWKEDRLSDADAEALDQLIRSKQLAVDSISGLLKLYRELELELPHPTRVPGVIEGDAKDSRLYVRGDHKQPAESVPRRYLEVLDDQPFQTSSSGRLELAERIADMKTNPLTARVIVNRLWHHVFGRGLVASVDNFGKLGDLPSHPDLLDLLAQRFIESGGNIKQILRAILLTKTFRRASDVPTVNTTLDPENKSLASYPMRRLEAEAIRDSVVSLTGKLNTELYGESVDSDVERRSVYVKVIRNRLDPFLTTFDAPVPFSTRGKRDITNVPAQSLTLLNDPNVIRWSRDWARRILETPHQTTEKKRVAGIENVTSGPLFVGSESDVAELRVRKMFREAFAREADDDEVNQCVCYVSTILAKVTEKQQEISKREERLKEVADEIDATIKPARERLIASTQVEHREQPEVAAPSSPVPIAEWTFDNDTSDSIGKLSLSLTGSARVENGALILDGQSMAESGSLPKQLIAKTMEAWVKLDNLTQQGGGIVTLQGKNGVLFDSIVFGERKAGQWLAGSNNFARSEILAGPVETEAAERPVHIAIVYQADGFITGYREGKPYGQSYRKAPSAVFEPESSQVLLGCRHGQPSGNHGVQGRIFRARLYDRALSADEIAVSSRVEKSSISDADVLVSLSEAQRNQVIAKQHQRNELAKAIEAAKADSNRDPPVLQAWSSLAQSLINLKEFIYLR